MHHCCDEVPDATGHVLHLFDAKFRVSRLDPIVEEREMEDDPENIPERRGIFKRDDLYKMHTYRDAIPAARSVWVLYPGTESRFYQRSGAVISDLVAQNLPVLLDGVGAVPLQPDLSTYTELSRLLRQILSAH